MFYSTPEVEDHLFSFPYVYADKNGGKYLTRILGYRPMTQLEDIAIVKAMDQRRINPQVSLLEKGIRILLLGFATILFIVIVQGLTKPSFSA